MIELIVVIVILGILSAVAMPRFIDVGTEAKIAKLESLKGSIQAGAQLVFAKAFIQGVHDKLNSTVDIDGDGTADINTHSGFPGVMSNCSQFVRQTSFWLNINLPSSCSSNKAVSEEWIGIASGWRFYFIPSGYTDQNDNCYLLYTEARKTSGGVESTLDNVGLQIVSSGC